jgi:hypothetical protein
LKAVTWRPLDLVVEACCKSHEFREQPVFEPAKNGGSGKRGHTKNQKIS